MRSEIFVHKSSIDANFEAIKRRLKPGVKVMAVVKDNAYGHGLVEFATHIQGKTDWFCVVRVEEGVVLREAGITNPILVFEVANAERAPLYPKYDLTATVGDITGFKLLEEGTSYHINFDTGMKRLGMYSSQIPEVLEQIKMYSNIYCKGIYTHYANSDAEEGNTVAEQLKLFTEIRSHFPEELMTHTANSGGIFYHTDKDVQFDAVRPGISLYGYAPGDEVIPDLKSVIDWKSQIMQAKRIKKGEAVSYGCTWKAPKDGWIGAVPVGYSDGVPRILGSEIQLMKGNEFLQQAGRVTMDYIMVFSENEIQLGEEIFLFNRKELTPNEWATKSGTISYEITTRLNQRTKRFYF